MSIKIKLLISYLATFIVPLILIIFSALFIGMLYLDIFPGQNRLFSRYTDFRTNIVKGNKILDETMKVAYSNPEKLLDKNYENRVDNVLKALNAGIVIRKNDTNVYISDRLNNSAMLNKLRETDTFYNSQNNNFYLDKHYYSLDRTNFSYADRTRGEVIVITDMTPFKKFAFKYIVTLTIACIAILVLTNMIITVLMSRGFIRPLANLKKAANEIKEGNLDYEIKHSSKDEFAEVFGAFEDMRQKLQESHRLEQQYENNRKELISNISHDLKTPIASIKGYVEGIMDGVADTPEKMDRYIKTIYTKANDIDKLIDELFLFSKLDLKKIPFSFENVDILGYLKDCADELAFDLESRGVKLNFTTDIIEPEYVYADREKLRRVIINIVSNSVKYVEAETGEINIDLKNGKDKVIVHISDNGKGIDGKDLPYIFDRFYRADMSRNTAKGGSGLGLAIAKQIIEEHQGKIWAVSRIGFGTSVSFTLKKV